MKKLGLVTLGIVAGIVALVNLGSLLALALSALVAYMGFHYFRKSISTLSKFFWGAVLLVGLLTAISNVPAFFGIIAIVGLLYVWQKWNGSKKEELTTHTDDPFVNFERQWNEIIK